MALAMTSPKIVPLVVVPVVDRCDDCGINLEDRHRARCSCCGAELCTDCDAFLAWDVRQDPAGPTFCGWCSGPFDEAA